MKGYIVSDKVIIGMSGDVDSAATAFLLREAGYEVIGVTLRTWDSGGSRCCEIDEARAMARKLGISYHVLNCVSDFQKNVQMPFIDAYLRGLTPNPCVVCHRTVKWERPLYTAAVMRADMVATGHYASYRVWTTGVTQSDGRPTPGRISLICSTV